MTEHDDVINKGAEISPVIKSDYLVVITNSVGDFFSLLFQIRVACIV